VSGLAALIAACGTPAASPGAERTTTTASATAPPTTAPGSDGSPTAGACGVVPGAGVVVTSTVPCRGSTGVGGVVRVELDPGYNWTTPVSDSSAVEVTAVRRGPSGRLNAELLAVDVGQAIVSSAGSVLCPAGQACPALVRLWKLIVVVHG
jgi:hypothetical protein